MTSLPKIYYSDGFTFNKLYAVTIIMRGDSTLSDKDFLNEIEWVVKYICSKRGSRRDGLPIYQTEGPYRYLSKSGKKDFIYPLEFVIKVRIGGFKMVLNELIEFKSINKRRRDQYVDYQHFIPKYIEIIRSVADPE